MIELKVVSPQKVIFQKEVEMAVLPGAEGDFAAMENHSPFISSLRPGQMAIMANNQLQESFFVSGGLVMLKDKTCEVSAMSTRLLIMEVSFKSLIPFS